MSDAGIPLRIIQEVSGHRNLSQLQNYLEVRDSQVLGAVSALSMLSPQGGDVRKLRFPDITKSPSDFPTESPDPHSQPPQA
jgi:integrase/recombinase XerD